MSDPNSVETAVVKKARNVLEAELLAGILESEGIPAFVDGRFLQDEFAMPKKMLGLDHGVRVRVRKEHLEEAKKILELARESGKSLDEGDGEGDETPD